MQNLVSLPDYYLITPEPEQASDTALATFLERLVQALEGGRMQVQLRAKTLATGPYAALAAAVLPICRRYDARLILNGPIDIERACWLGVDGVHLTSTSLLTIRARPAPLDLLVSAACHTYAELQQAAHIGADFVTLSPVLSTPSHPEVAGLGWARFTELVAQASVPVYALGGMTPAHLVLARASSARGVAGIRGFW